MVKNPWTCRKRRAHKKREPMSNSIGTQTSPEKYKLEEWNPKVLMQQLTKAQITASSFRSSFNAEPNVIEKTIDPVISQYNDLPKISRLPNNYNVFVRPINNNEKANSTLASGFLSHSESHPQRLPSIELATYKVTGLYKPGPKCYKRLHEEFHSEFDVPILRNDGNSNNSLNNSLTVIHEQAEDIMEPLPQISLTDCVNDKDVPPVVDISFTDYEITETAGLTGLLDNPSDVLIDVINEGMLEINSPMTQPMPKTLGNNSNVKDQPFDNAGDQKRRRNKTVTFEYRDIQTEIVENAENGQTTAPNDNEENDSMEDDNDITNHLRKPKYIRIFAEKVNIYNHFYN